MKSPSKMGLPDSSGLIVGVNTIDYDVSIRNKTQTREEKKTEMIMKAIDKMERAEERRRQKGEGAQPGKRRRSNSDGKHENNTDSAVDASHDAGPSWKKKRKENGKNVMALKTESLAVSDENGSKKPKKKKKKDKHEEIENVMNETGGSSDISPEPLTSNFNPSHRVKKRPTARMSTAGVSRSFGLSFKETDTASASQSRPPPTPSSTVTSSDIVPPPPSSSYFVSTPPSSSNFVPPPASSSSFVFAPTSSTNFVSA